jgi:hypothetical protein
MNYSDANTIVKTKESQLPNMFLIPLLIVGVLHWSLTIPIIIVIIWKIYVTNKATYYVNHNEVIIHNHYTENRTLYRTYIFDVTHYQRWWEKPFNIGTLLLDVRQHEYYDIVVLKNIENFNECYEELKNIKSKKDEFGYDPFTIIE